MGIQLPPSVRRSALRLPPSYVLVIAAGIFLQLAVLAGIRLWAADASGGDLCRDVVAVHRMVQGQNPYAPISGCGALYNLPHPPAFLLLIGPFVLLPVSWGAALWDLVGLGALALGIALIARELRLRLPTWVLALLIVLLAFWPPLLDTLLEAQISPMLFLLCTLAWLYARQGRSGWAGAALGVAAAIRLFPGLALLYFVLRRDWRATLAGVVMCALCELLALPLIGVRGFWAYLAHEAPSTSAQWLINPHNVSAWGLAGMIFAGSGVAHPLVPAPGLARIAAEVLLVVLIGGLALLTLARRQRPFVADEGTFLAYVPAMLLASPLTWSHYFVLLLLPILVLAVRAVQARKGPQVQWLRGLLIAAVALIWLNDWLARQPHGNGLPAAYALLVLALPTYALLALGAGLVLMDGESSTRTVPVPDPEPVPAAAR